MSCERIGSSDKNKDRNLSLDEFEAAPDRHAERQQFEFDRADLNHDGKVTRDEGARSVQERFERVRTT